MIEPPWLDRSAYPFAYSAMDVSGRIHYVDEGSGPPILLVHGTPTWSFEYRHLIRSLAPRWRTIAPDYLEFGLSSQPSRFKSAEPSGSPRLYWMTGRGGFGAGRSCARSPFATQFGFAGSPTSL